MANLTQLLSSQPGQTSRLWPAMEGMLRKFSLNFDNMLPAAIVSYDRTNNVAEVKPLIQVVKLDGALISRNTLAKVPVISIGGGGFHLSFPFKTGDLGWIMSTDRDYAIFMQTLKESAPNSTRAHKFEDSVFLPDVMRKYTIDQEDNESLVLQSTDSKTRISIKSGEVTITAPTKVSVNTPLAQFSNDVSIEGNLTVSKNVEVDGDGNVKGTLTNSGINVTTHGHLENGKGSRTGNMES